MYAFHRSFISFNVVIHIQIYLFARYWLHCIVIVQYFMYRLCAIHWY